MIITNNNTAPMTIRIIYIKVTRNITIISIINITIHTNSNDDKGTKGNKVYRLLF